MQNSVKTSEFKFLLLAVFVLIISSIDIQIGSFALKVPIDEKYLDAVMGMAGGWAVLRQTVKAKNGQ